MHVTKCGSGKTRTKTRSNKTMETLKIGKIHAKEFFYGCVQTIT